MKVTCYVLCIVWIIFYFIYHCTDNKKVRNRVMNFLIIYSFVEILFTMSTIAVLLVDSEKEKENNSSSNSNDYSTEQTFYYEQNAIAISEQMFETEDGNMWIMKNVQLKKGEKYIVTFDNHDTEIITDDEIVDFIELNEKVD